jgi:hypothetical protein
MDSIKERVLKSASYYGFSVRKFEKKCQLNRGVLSNMNENSSLGSDKLACIFDNCPEINATWLVTGHGEMLQNPQANGGISGNTIVGTNAVGNGNTIQPTISSKSIFDIAKNYQEVIKKQQEQIGSLIEVISKLSSK